MFIQKTITKSKQILLKMTFIFAMVLTICSPIRSEASGSVIGNGGDPLFYFLEAVRMSLIDTLKKYNDMNDPKQACQMSNLTIEQMKACQKLIEMTVEQLLKLNLGVKKTVFILRDEPLMVLGPDKWPMPVAAKTMLGPEGPIEFHHQSLRSMAPAQAFLLMMHEFLHKVTINGHYVSDNEEFPPFNSGREYIDSMAMAMLKLAKEKGKIGSQFSLRDSFHCTVIVNESKIGVRASTPRLFLSEDLLAYETSIGRNPIDALIYIPETSKSDLVFRFVIHEPANCSKDPQYDSKRYTEVAIVRSNKIHSFDSGLDMNGYDFGFTENEGETVLESAHHQGFNPICNKDDPTLYLSYKNVQFSCRHYGVEGTTSYPRID